MRVSPIKLKGTTKIENRKRKFHFSFSLLISYHQLRMTAEYYSEKKIDTTQNKSFRAMDVQSLKNANVSFFLLLFFVVFTFYYWIYLNHFCIINSIHEYRQHGPYRFIERMSIAYKMACFAIRFNRFIFKCTKEKEK